MLVAVGYALRGKSNTSLEGIVQGDCWQIPVEPKSQLAWVLTRKETSWSHLSSRESVSSS
jgi:hypothetical protein